MPHNATTIQRVDPHNTMLLSFLIPTLQLTSAITGFLRSTALLIFVCFVRKIEVKFLHNNCR